jgi:hypothetical protein
MFILVIVRKYVPPGTNVDHDELLDYKLIVCPGIAYYDGVW